jgi:hypothetical protein
VEDFARREAQLEDAGVQRRNHGVTLLDDARDLGHDDGLRHLRIPWPGPVFPWI